MVKTSSAHQGNVENLDFKHLILKNNQSEDVSCRYYQADKPKAAVVMVGGVGGGFDTPAKQLYPKLASTLAQEGISGLRIQFRHPTDLGEATQDVLLGIQFLESEGIIRLGLVGHSLGGAVIIQAAAQSKSVKTVVTLATQGFGADDVTKLPADTSILLIHGADDHILPPAASAYVYTLAHEPKRIEILPENGHMLDEGADQVFHLVHDWLIAELCRAPQASQAEVQLK